ncbi:MAG: TetR/AcrR family transcriptional regulator [Acidimicrobiales bacterium]
MGQRTTVRRGRVVTGRGTAHGTEPPAPRRLRRQERRAAIIDGAAAAFAPGGYKATSMADIAAAAGVSHLIVYRHFDSKEVLYEAVLERAVEHLADALSDDRAAGTYGPTPGALLDAARLDPSGFGVLWRHASREPEFALWSDRARSLLAEVTTSALARHVAPDHLSWAVRATVAYLVEAVLVWVEDGDRRLDDRFVAATNAALMAGVKSWAAAR